MLDLQNIVVTFGKNTPAEKVILDNANLSLQQGEFAALIGNNGSGKSTMAKVIAGEIKIDSGDVLINNINCNEWGVSQRSSMISRVFQDPMRGTVPGLSVLENLVFASQRGQKRRLLPAIKKYHREFFAEKLSVLNIGLEDKIDILVKMLSGGQRQALSLLMATLSPAKILLLDEHTAALDPEAGKLVMRFTHQILKDHKLTALMITHDMRELDYCDTVFTISDGKIKSANKIS